MDYYMHVLPGKIQIRTSELRKNKDKVFIVSRFLDSFQGVTSVKINDVLGSILIHYDCHATSYQMIVNQLVREGLVPDVKLRTHKNSNRTICN